MPRLLITNGVQEGRALRLRPGINRIGRSVDTHFQVPDPSVSSVHCEVILSDTGVVVRDLNSTNGTFINGVPLQEGTVGPGQVLQLGNIEMRFEEALENREGAAVEVPELIPAAPVASMTLSDGSPACANHPELPGAHRCTKCQQSLCESCVRIIKRISGETMVFCSLCGGPCEVSLTAAPQKPAAPAHREGFFRRLTQTLKLTRKP